MKKGGELTKRIARAICACLFAVHAFGFLQASTAHPAPGDPSYGAVLVDGVVAECADSLGRGAPSPVHDDHSECCTLCSANGSDDVFLAAVSLTYILTFLSPDAESAGHCFNSPDLPCRRHAGWGSSWSAQAPPLA